MQGSAARAHCYRIRVRRAEVAAAIAGPEAAVTISIGRRGGNFKGVCALGYLQDNLGAAAGRSSLGAGHTELVRRIGPEQEEAVAHTAHSEGAVVHMGHWEGAVVH